MASGHSNPIGDYNPPEFNGPGTVWDYVVVSNVASPGYCEISGFDRQYSFDIKPGKGSQGANITYTGLHPAEGEIKFYLWTQLHFQFWETTFRPVFKYDPTKTKEAQAVSIFHPSLADLDIKRVLIKSLSPIRHEGLQLYSCTAKLLEFVPPPKASAVKTVTAAKPDTFEPQGPPAPSPLDPLQQKIAPLLQTYQYLK